MLLCSSAGHPEMVDWELQVIKLFEIMKLASNLSALLLSFSHILRTVGWRELLAFLFGAEVEMISDSRSLLFEEIKHLAFSLVSMNCVKCCNSNIFRNVRASNSLKIMWFNPRNVSSKTPVAKLAQKPVI